MSADSLTLSAKFSKYLRITDVCDGLDAVGRADICLMDRSIRPLWMGMRFFGPAFTMRLVPANRHMPVLTREQALEQHSIWGKMGGWKVRWEPLVKPGCVVVMSTGGARECAFWGSNNTMDMHNRGAVGIVTEGYCRDTDEVILQKMPVACAQVGRTIIPGRVELIEVDTPIGCGGVQVRPGDIVGCDWDGALVVPIEVAEDVLAIAARIAVEDKKQRRALYQKLGKPLDDTVDVEAAAAWFREYL